MAKILISKIGYYHDQLFEFVAESSGRIKLVPASAGFNPLITILSIKHYHESIKKYPVVDQTTVKKALKFECRAHDVFAQIGKKEDNSTQANIWQINTTINSKLKGLLVPETFLLATEKQLICAQHPCYQAPLYCHRDGSISSSIATKIINSPELFLYSVGVNPECTVKQLDTSQLLTLFVTNLAKKLVSTVKIFHNIELNNFIALLKPIYLALALGGGFYLTATSLALYVQQQQIDNALESTVEKSNSLLLLDNQLTEQSKYHHFLATKVKEKNNVSVIWPIIEPILKDTKLSSISFEQAQYVLRGSADNASKILAQLINDKRISNAQFDTPVRKYRGKDNFVISFSIAFQPEF